MADHVETGRFYTEELTALPFSVMRKLLVTTLPEPFASGIAGLLWTRGRICWPMAAMHGVAFDERLLRVAREDVPAEALSRWGIIEEPLRDLGFHTIYIGRPKTIGPLRKAFSLWLNPAAKTIANLEWAYAG